MNREISSKRKQNEFLSFSSSLPFIFLAIFICFSGRGSTATMCDSWLANYGFDATYMSLISCHSQYIRETMIRTTLNLIEGDKGDEKVDRCPLTVNTLSSR